MLAVLWFVAGLGLLITAAEMIVRGASRLALALGVTPLMVGLTIVAVGTSMPELAVGITASHEDAGGLVVGNIAGTNLVNILFILGLSALLRPLPLHRQVLMLDLPMIVLASALMAALAWDGLLSALDGAVMCGVAVLYTVQLVRMSRTSGAALAGVAQTRRLAPRDCLLLTAGIALSVPGAHWLVQGAVAIARDWGVSDATIGLTIVAIGTSSPELVTALVSTLRNERDVAIGNLLGSSTYNILVILAVTCLMAPSGLPVPRQLLAFDIPLMIGITLLCVAAFASGRTFSRAEGGLFVSLYLAYLAYVLRNPA